MYSSNIEDQLDSVYFKNKHINRSARDGSKPGRRLKTQKSEEEILSF